LGLAPRQHGDDRRRCLYLGLDAVKDVTGEHLFIDALAQETEVADRALDAVLEQIIECLRERHGNKDVRFALRCGARKLGEFMCAGSAEPSAPF
jgi:hypothetical protein